MVKGMTRRIVELKETGSNYFERAIFFVRMDASSNASEFTLSQEARRIIDDLSKDLPVDSDGKGRRLKKCFITVIKAAVSAAAGALAAIVIFKLH